MNADRAIHVAAHDVSARFRATVVFENLVARVGAALPDSVTFEDLDDFLERHHDALIEQLLAVLDVLDRPGRVVEILTQHVKLKPKETRQVQAVAERLDAAMRVFEAEVYRWTTRFSTQGQAMAIVQDHLWAEGALPPVYAAPDIQRLADQVFRFYHAAAQAHEVSHAAR